MRDAQMTVSMGGLLMGPVQRPVPLRELADPVGALTSGRVGPVSGNANAAFRRIFNRARVDRTLCCVLGSLLAPYRVRLDV